MAIVEKQFHHHERGMGNEDWYYLARNTESGQVYVHHEWSRRQGDGYEQGNAHVELGAFFNRRGTAQENLLRLIGTLAEDR